MIKDYKMKKLKLLALLLTFAMVVGIIGVSAEQPRNSRGEVEAVSQLRAEDIPEVIDLNIIVKSNHVRRLYDEESGDLNSVIFQNDDDTQTLYYHGYEIKHINENGEVQDKSNALFSEFKTDYCSDTYAYVNLDNDIRTYFPQVLSEDTGVLLTRDDLDIKIELMPISENEAKVDNRSDDYDNENWVYYDGVFGENTALRYAPLFDGFKEEVVLYENVGNEFGFLLDTSGLKPEFDGDYINLIDSETKEIVAVISPIYVYDSEYNHTFDNSMKLSELDCGNYEIVVVVDDGFLSSDSTVYPVYVDPTVTVSGSGANKTIQDLTIYRRVGTTTTLTANINNATIGLDTATPVANISRLLMRFPGVVNHSSLKNLPPENITGATLQLQPLINFAGNWTIGAYQYTGNSGWSEVNNGATITWAGFDSSARIASSGSPASSGWNEFNIRGAVRDWLGSETRANRGLLFKNDVTNGETNSGTRKVFHTSEASGSGTRPRVVVEFTPRHTVTFNANGGTVSPTSRLVNHNSTVGTLPAPTRADHAFIGWFNSSETLITSGTTVTQNMTVTARWASTNTNIVNGGTYYIKNLVTGRYMEDNYAGVQQYSIRTTNDGVPRQRWRVIHSSNGRYWLQPMVLDHINYSYTLALTSDSSGSLSVLNRSSTTTNNQLFIISQNSDGTNSIFLNTTSSRAFTVASNTNGTAVTTAIHNSSNNNMKWQFEMVGNSFSAAMTNHFDGGFSTLSGNDVSARSRITAEQNLFNSIMLSRFNVTITNNTPARFTSIADNCPTAPAVTERCQCLASNQICRNGTSTVHCKNYAHFLFGAFPPGSSSSDTSKIITWSGHITCQGSCVGNNHSDFYSGGAATRGGKRSINTFSSGNGPLGIDNEVWFRYLMFHEAAHLFGAPGDFNCHDEICVVSYESYYTEGGMQVIYEMIRVGDSDIFCDLCATQINEHLLTRF